MCETPTRWGMPSSRRFQKVFIHLGGYSETRAGAGSVVVSRDLAMVTTWVQIPASALQPTFWAALAVFDRSLTSGSSAGATLNRLPPISIVTLRSCDRTAATGV